MKSNRKSRIEVLELCPHCGYENEFHVDSDTWVEDCNGCGKPILLCDKCEDHGECGKCPHGEDLKEAMKHARCYEVAEKFCEDTHLLLISVDNILKGRRMEITVATQGNNDSKGRLIKRSIVIAYGVQELEVSEFIYNVIRNDNSCLGTDGIALYNFTNAVDAREWIRKDIERTLAMLDSDKNEKDLRSGEDYWIYDVDNTLIDWSIRRLPLQHNDIWTDPDYPVKYKLKSRRKR